MCEFEEDWWIRGAKRRERLRLIQQFADAYRADETLEDANRRILTVLWIASGGEKGDYNARSKPDDLLRIARYEDFMGRALSPDATHEN